MSRIQFLGGHVTRQHESFPQRDFSGANARVSADLQPSAKSRIQGQLFRELSGLSDLTVSYALITGYSLNMAVEVAPKVKVSADARRQSIDYKGASDIPGVSDNARRDSITSRSLDLSYRETQHLVFGASLFDRTRQSNQSFIGFNSKGGFVSARYEF